MHILNVENADKTFPLFITLEIPLIARYLNLKKDILVIISVLIFSKQLRVLNLKV
jgi:hypothetical protein